MIEGAKKTSEYRPNSATFAYETPMQSFANSTDTESSRQGRDTLMKETYLHHPTFGLLFNLCPLGDTQGLFTTLYAQRLFFRATINPSPRERTIFESITRTEARQLVEESMRQIRRTGSPEVLKNMQQVYRKTFF
ncbi:MAG: PipX family protein [Cyanobacteria bacterium P01_F01_bin.3]